jgi:hypothetical protein
VHVCCLNGFGARWAFLLQTISTMGLSQRKRAKATESILGLVYGRWLGKCATPNVIFGKLILILFHATTLASLSYHY